MNQHIYYILIILIGISLAYPAQAQWEQTNGPHTGSHMISLAWTGSSIIAGSKEQGARYRIYRSTNSGNTWVEQSPGLDNVSVNSFEVAGTNVFAATNVGVYQSTDDGANWTALATLPDVFAHTVLSLPDVNSGLLFAGFSAKGAYRSTNNGLDWTEVNNGLTNTHIHTLAYTHSALFAGTQTGVFKSTDLGDTWVAVNAGIDSITVWRLLAVDDGSGNSFLVAGSYDQGIYRSSDLGTSWQEVYQPDTIRNINSIVFDGTYVIAGTASMGTLRSTDFGASWEVANQAYKPKLVYDLLLIPQPNADPLLFEAGFVGICLSTDRGITWMPMNNGLPTLNTLSFGVHGNMLFAGTQGTGAFRTSDNGDTWINVTDFNDWREVRAFASSGDMVYMGIYNVYRSSDKGMTWVPCIGVERSYITAIQASSNKVFAATSKGVYTSTDFGVTWDMAPSPLSGLEVESLCLLNDGYTLFAGTDTDGIYRSTDSGGSWVNVLPWEGKGAIFDLVAMDSDVFAIRGQDIYHSSDRGNSWSKHSLGLFITYVYDLEVYGSNLFAATWYDGIYLSTNKGNSWKNIASSFEHPYIFAIAVNNGYLFAGVDIRGVWRRPLSDMVVSVGAPSEAASSPLLHQNYPNPFNPSTTINYELQASGYASLKVYSALGKEVSILVDDYKNAGQHSVQCNAANLPGRMYLYRLTVNGAVLEKKMLLLK